MSKEVCAETVRQSTSGNMRARLWLPILYVIAAGYLVFGRPAGHG